MIKLKDIASKIEGTFGEKPAKGITCSTCNYLAALVNTYPPKGDIAPVSTYHLAEYLCPKGHFTYYGFLPEEA